MEQVETRQAPIPDLLFLKLNVPFQLAIDNESQIELQMTRYIFND